MSEELPPFTDYGKKNKFKIHLKKNQFNGNFPENAKLIAFGFNGKTYDDYVNYYKKYKCITNKESMILKEE